MRPTVLNLDDDTSGGHILVTEFHGFRVALTKDRVHELLRREQDYLALIATGEAKSPPVADSADDGERFEFHARQLPEESVSHASLSTRIKKIHAYSLRSHKLRSAHIGLLQELISGFDWVIPEHATTRLEGQLLEMLGWREVPDSFRAIAMKFLERYSKAKRARG